MAFEFDRYINGQLMAEGVTIERQNNLSDAMREAARIASRGPNGEVPVLVLRALAERAGGVKVDSRALNMAISKWATDSDLHITIGDAEALHEAIVSCITTEPAAPEGRQEAVETRIAWEALECIVARADASKLSPIQYEAAEVAAKIARNALEARGEISPVDFPSGLFPTRPSEQAVTEAMVEALRNIDAEAPAKEPRDDWTSTDLDEAFYEGKLRGFWEMAVYAREALTAALGAQTPPEGAVTDAMVEAACLAWVNSPSPLEDSMRAALKAAMEAERHD